MKLHDLKLTETELRIVEDSLKFCGDRRLKRAMIRAATRNNSEASDLLQQGMVLHALSEKARLTREGTL